MWYEQRASASGGRSQALTDLQEGLGCVFEAFDLIDADGDGKCTSIKAMMLEWLDISLSEVYVGPSLVLFSSRGKGRRQYQGSTSHCVG